MRKKIIATLIIIITSISIFSPLVKANGISTNQAMQQFMGLGQSSSANVTSSQGQSQVVGLTVTQSQEKTLANGLAKTIAVLPFLLNKLMEIVAYEESAVAELLKGIFHVKNANLFTIEKLLTGQYPLFDINLFEDVASGPQMNLINSIKAQAAIWYVGVRNISIIGCAIVLIYVGIRLAIATTAEDVAKYKKMLMGWVVGLILLFFIHYIVLIMIRIANVFIEFITTAIEKDTNTVNMEIEVLTDVFDKINKTEGWDKLFYLLLYIVLTYYELKFFIMYLFRVFKIFIMMVISPLVCMTYPIDVIGDGRAQAFNNWLREMIMQVFIQPIHLLVYVVFIYSAGEIAKTAPLIAIMFIIALDNAEKIVRSALKIPGKGLKDIKFLQKGK